MANTKNNKRKILALKEILERESNESHPLNIGELGEKLEQMGFPAEKKSIVRDLHELEEAGMVIDKTRSRMPGYYLAQREFELPELKLLADAVAASQLITEKKSRLLLDKLGSLTNRYDAKQLQRQVMVANRVKGERESSLYSIDSIFACIDQNRQMRFQYMDWQLHGEEKLLLPRHGGRYYQVSPLALFWDSERYYLIAYAEREGQIRFYRVDKILEVSPLDRPRNPQGLREWEQMDQGQDLKGTFSMYAGRETWMSLDIDPSFTGVFIDRFGREVSMRSLPDGKIRVRLLLQVSPQFFGWLAGLGEGVTIHSPNELAQEYISYLEGILRQYQKK